MAYKTRPGIAQVKICGVNLLVPTRAVSEDCAKILQISSLGAMIWKLLDDGKSMHTINMLCAIMKRIPVEEGEREVEEYLRALFADGFLIPLSEDNHTEITAVEATDDPD